MALTADDFTGADPARQPRPILRAMAAAAREEWSGLRVTVVDALDVRGETGPRDAGRQRLLMESDGHLLVDDRRSRCRRRPGAGGRS